MSARENQSLSVTTANVDPDTATAWLKVEVAPEHLALRVLFTATGASGSATINAMLRKSDGTAIWSDSATATVTARRTGADGASGSYVCSVAFAQTGNEYFDLAGFIKPNTKAPGNAVSPDGVEVWVGVVGFTTISAGTLTVVPVTEI